MMDETENPTDNDFGSPDNVFRMKSDLGIRPVSVSDKRRKSTGYVAGILVLAIVSAILWVFGQPFPDGFRGNRDGADYAVIGRNLLNSGKFTANTVYPLYLSFEFTDLDGIASERPVPELNRQPLFPLYLALSFGIGGVSSKVARAAAYIPFVLTALLLFLAGSRFVGGFAAFAASLLYISSPEVVTNALQTLSEPLAALIFTALFLVLPGKDISIRRALSAGILTGLLVMIRLPFVALVIPVAVSVIFRHDSIPAKKNIFGRETTVFFLIWSTGAIIVVIPWLVRNVLVTGNPIFAIQSYCEISKFIPGSPPYAAHRSMEPLTIMHFAMMHPIVFFEIQLHNLLVMLHGLVGIFGVFLIVLIPAMMESRGKISLKEYSFILITLAMVVFIYAFLSPDGRHLLPLYPATALSVMGFAASTVRGRRILPVFLVVVTAVNLGVDFRNFREASSDDFGSPGISAESLHITGIGPVITDIPTSFAWNTGRMSIWLPVDETTLNKVCTLVSPAAIFISEDVDEKYLEPFGGIAGFEKCILGNGFSLKEELEGGTLYLRPGLS